MSDRLADFEMRRRLGAGSFGEVHAAYDRRRHANVALKRLRQASPVDLYRFKKEFRALAGVFHPNLVSLHELFASGDDWYIAMELVVGVDIVRHAHTTAMDVAPRVVRDTFRQLVAGVGALHHAKRLHRDLKPANVLVDAEGKVKVLDFGLITELTDPSSSLLQIVGTPAYM